MECSSCTGGKKAEVMKGPGRFDLRLARRPIWASLNEVRSPMWDKGRANRVAQVQSGSSASICWCQTKVAPVWSQEDLQHSFRANVQQPPWSCSLFPLFFCFIFSRLVTRQVFLSWAVQGRKDYSGRSQIGEENDCSWGQSGVKNRGREDGKWRADAENETNEVTHPADQGCRHVHKVNEALIEKMWLMESCDYNSVFELGTSTRPEAVTYTFFRIISLLLVLLHELFRMSIQSQNIQKT